MPALESKADDVLALIVQPLVELGFLAAHGAQDGHHARLEVAVGGQGLLEFPRHLFIHLLQLTLVTLDKELPGEGGSDEAGDQGRSERE